MLTKVCSILFFKDKKIIGDFVTVYAIFYCSVRLMASRKRKRVLPPWLQGVSVKQGVPVKKDSAVGNDKGTDDSTDDHQSKGNLYECHYSQYKNSL